MSNFSRPQGLGKFSMFPPVIKSLLVINLAVYVLQHIFLKTYTIDGASLADYFVYYFALQPLDSSFLNLGVGDFWPWQVITYQFMHGGFWHLFFNLFALWMFGAELESRWGSRQFILYYLLCGIGAAVVQMFIADGPTIGASGSVYGILLAFAMTFPNRPIFMFPFFIPIPAKFFVLIFVGIQMISGLSSSDDGIAYFAHLGGAATGFLLMKFGEKIGIYRWFDKLVNKGQGKYSCYKEEKEVKVYSVNWQKTSSTTSSVGHDTSTSTRPVGRIYSIDGEDVTQEKIDAILDKISSSGYQNLSDKEKYILNELSKKL